MRAFPFPDRIEAREELKRDILYDKIPSEHLAGISDRAWETGVSAAQSVMDEYGTSLAMEEIAKKSGLIVERIKKDNIAGSIRYFSEYYSGPNKIFLYVDSITKWAHCNNIPLKEAEELILSHEFYHFLECTRLGLTSKQYTVPSLSLGPIILARSGIRALSEIGAHGFSRSIYELKCGMAASNVINCNSKLKNQAVNAFTFDGKQAVERIFSKAIFKLFLHKNVGG